MNNKVKDILIRAAKTFIQAFVSAISVDAFLGVTDLTTLKKIAISLLVGAVAAGVCAVWNSLWNSFKEWLTIRIGDIEEGDGGDI